MATPAPGLAATARSKVKLVHYPLATPVYKLNIVVNHWVNQQNNELGRMAESSKMMMQFLVKSPPKLSNSAENFVREHPEDALEAIAAALETAAAQSAVERIAQPQDIPEVLLPFVVERDRDDLIGVTEAARRLGVSRTTIYDWAARKTLIAWRSTKRGLNIPESQILGLGRVVPGLANVVEIVGDPQLAWAFLNQEWPFEDVVALPIDKLKNGQHEDVLAAAAGFGTTFT